MRELTLRPSMLVRIAFVVLFLGLAAMFLAGVKDIPPRGAGDWFNIAIALACIYAAITYPMRAVVFTQGTVRVQSMGRCRTNRLPARVRVQPGLSLGSLYVVDDANQQVLVIVKREFGPIASLEARIKSWLRGEGRLAEPQEASAARTGTNRAR